MEQTKTFNNAEKFNILISHFNGEQPKFESRFTTEIIKHLMDKEMFNYNYHTNNNSVINCKKIIGKALYYVEALCERDEDYSDDSIIYTIKRYFDDFIPDNVDLILFNYYKIYVITAFRINITVPLI